MRLIHTLPHRSGPVLLGLVNIRGQIRLCVSLSELLGLKPADDTSRTTNHKNQHGIQRFHLSALRDAPVTVAKATPRLTKGVIGWQDKGVGYLDDELLFLALRKEVL